MGTSILQVGQADTGEGGSRLVATHGAAGAFDAQGIGHVFSHGHMRPEAEVLEDHGETAPRGRHVAGGAVDHFTVGPQFAAVGAEESGGDVKQGGLAATGLAEERDAFAVADGQRHVPQDRDPAQRLGDIAAGQFHGSHLTQLAAAASSHEK